jgi:hypothetical protein
MCTQYLIQPAIACTIHQSQGLTLDFLAFDPSGIHHHELIYTTLFCVREMQHLKTTAQCQLCVPYLQLFRQTHIIIQSLNTRSLSLHFQNVETDHNLQTFHILCLNEIKVKIQNKSSRQYSNRSKYKSIVTYGR